MGAELSAAAGNQLFIPIGFAHGFLTLEAECEIVYKVSSPYAPANDGGIRWDDAAIAVDWPIPEGIQPLLSEKDAGLPTLAEFQSPFAYDGHPLCPLT